MGLLSGLTAAFAYMQVVALSRIGEPETRTVFYFARRLGRGRRRWRMLVDRPVAAGTGATRCGCCRWACWPPLGQLCMTRAYASAKTESGTLVVANLQYSGIVFAAIYSVLLFGDRIDAAGWAGMALIVASGIAATVLRQRVAAQGAGRGTLNGDHRHVHHPDFRRTTAWPCRPAARPLMVFDCSFDLMKPEAGARSSTARPTFPARSTPTSTPT